MSYTKSIGQGVRGLWLSKILVFPLTLNVALTTLTLTLNSSIFVIITVVAFALFPFLYSRDNEAVQQLYGVTSSGL